MSRDEEEVKILNEERKVHYEKVSMYSISVDLRVEGAFSPGGKKREILPCVVPLLTCFTPPHTLNNLYTYRCWCPR